MKLISYLRLSVPCAIALIGVASAGVDSAATAAHLLSYLAKDYGGAVRAGKVLDAGEYAEQVEFSATVEARMRELGYAELVTAAGELKRIIAQKSDAAIVARQALALQSKLVAKAHLGVTPPRFPDLGRGRELYRANCVSCHGSRGDGQGPAAAALTPRPSNFLDPKTMAVLSPWQAMNTIKLGVPGTGMTAFAALGEGEVWDLAFYVLSLRHGDPLPQGRALLSRERLTLADVSMASEEALAKRGLGEPARAALRRASERVPEVAGSEGRVLAIALEKLAQAEAHARAGDWDQARDVALAAYLEGVEPIEPTLALRSQETLRAVEAAMARLRTAIADHAELSVLADRNAEARAQVIKARDTLGASERSGPWVFSAVLAVILREGLEAMLIVVAMLSVIRAAQNRRAALFVHGGWLSASAVGWVFWFASGWLLALSGASREAMEGVISLIAVVVLIGIGFWLHSRTELQRWRRFIDVQVRGALSSGKLWALASISFFAVFREAIETVLFLRAIALDSRGYAGWFSTGVLASLALLLLFGWVFLNLTRRLPIRSVFLVCAWLMALLAVVLAGKGVHALQEAGWMEQTPIGGAWGFELLGVYPAVQPLVAQAVVVVVIAGLASWKRPNWPT